MCRFGWVLILWSSSWLSNHFAKEEKACCFVLCCGCLCSVPFPHNILDRSASLIVVFLGIRTYLLIASLNISNTDACSIFP